MKKTLKGFTLIECLVALAILGIASLTMAQIYARVAARNNMNHLVNTSLAYQMKYVESYTDSETISVKYNFTGDTAGVPPHRGGSTSGSGTMQQASSSNKSFVKIISSYNSETDAAPAHAKGNSYSYPVNIYVLQSRDRGDRDSNDSGYENGVYDEKPDNLRYKYVLGAR